MRPSKNNFILIVLIAFSALVARETFGQSNKEPTDKGFQDDLLDHLIGKWHVTTVAHGFPSTATIEAKWVFNHQHFELHFIGDEVVPWIGVPMEFKYFIGFNHNSGRYIIHGVSVHGNDDDEGFWYADRTGNDLTLLQPLAIDSDTMNIQVITWEPATKTWHIQSRPRIAGKDGEVFLEMKLVGLKPSKKQKS